MILARNVLRIKKWGEFSEVSLNRLDMLARTFLKMSCFSKIKFVDLFWWVLVIFTVLIKVFRNGYHSSVLHVEDHRLKAYEFVF